MKVRIVEATTTNQKTACADLLAADPDLGHLDPDEITMWGALDEAGNLLAMAGAHFEPDSRHAELICCVVDPGARGKGLQKRLIKARVVWARKLGAVSISTYAYVGNAPSLISLLRCGFVPSELTDIFLTVSYPL